MIEIWKNVINYESKYEVSNLGNIRSITREVKSKNNSTRLIKGKVLKQQVNYKGYSIIGLSLTSSVKTHTLHQLVASAFIPNFTYGTEINHKDGNKLNNNITNLEISNSSHNQLHAVAIGLKKKTGKSSQYKNVSYIKSKNKWVGCIQHNSKSSFGWKTFNTEVEAAEHVDSILDSIGDTMRVRNFP